MGAQQSQLGTQTGQEKPGFLQGILPGKKEFQPLPIPTIIDLDFILGNRPNPPNNNQSSFQQFQQNNTQQIAKIILNYNKQEWNFGNLKVEGGNSQETPQKLMNENTYKLFKDFVTSIIVKGPSQSFTLPSNITAQNQESFEKNKTIILEINKNGFPKVDEFFTVKLSDLFPEINGFTEKDIINVTLLGLSAIIGAEHLVIYFLMCGANPGITYLSENEDTATLMLLYQIGLSKIQAPSKYFIILARILYILFLLGSVGSGVDLSKLFMSNFKVLKRNQGLTVLFESILHQLVRMPYINIDFSNQSKSLKFSKIENGASIPLLFKIIEKNNISDGPKFWSNINMPDLPLGYTVLYSLLMNNTIDGKIKLSLVWYLIKAGADPFIIPNVRQNAKIGKNVFAKDNQTEIQLLFALLQDSNIKILGDLLKILSLNPQFKQKYDEFKITKPGINQDKNMTIEQLLKNNEKLRGILEEVKKQKIIQINSAITESALIGSIKNKPLSTIPKLENPKPLEQKLQNPRQYPIESFKARGGKKNTERTFNLHKNKKYSEYQFKAERPIIAGHNAYEFLKLHDKIGKKKINLTLYDMANNKKYKYIAKTLKDGKNVLKSYK
jgi:hypothetical protein